MRSSVVAWVVIGVTGGAIAWAETLAARTPPSPLPSPRATASARPGVAASVKPSTAASPTGPSAAPSGSPSASPSPSSSPSPGTVGVQASPSPTLQKAPLSVADRTSLYREFQKAQQNELRALDHLQKTELRQLRAAQKAQYREWTRKEAVARRKYFAESHPGTEKRAYVQSFIRRREALWTKQKDQLADRTREQEARRNALRQEQHLKLQEFKRHLDLGERPPLVLWPSPGL